MLSKDFNDILFHYFDLNVLNSVNMELEIDVDYIFYELEEMEYIIGIDCNLLFTYFYPSLETLFPDSYFIIDSLSHVQFYDWQDLKELYYETDFKTKYYNDRDSFLEILSNCDSENTDQFKKEIDLMIIESYRCGNYE